MSDNEPQRQVIIPDVVYIPQTGDPQADYEAYQQSQGVPGFESDGGLMHGDLGRR